MVTLTAPHARGAVWRTPPAAEPDEVRVWLEWAGQRLLCMRIRGAAPAGFRNFWPDYVDTYGASNREALHLPKVAPADITYVELILTLPALCSDHQRRRILHARSLVHPLTGRYINSYGKIALREATDERKAARIYVSALAEVARLVPQSKASTIRAFLIR